jgi:hypothetical protein
VLKGPVNEENSGLLMKANGNALGVTKILVQNYRFAGDLNPNILSNSISDLIKNKGQENPGL